MGHAEPWFVPHVPSAVGEDAFGCRAEAAARFFGTPKYIAGQTAVVIAWIAVNAIAVGLQREGARFRAGEIAATRLGRPEDILGAVAFLLSDDAAWLTGQLIVVGGGLTIDGGSHPSLAGS